jgi:hypothetical protein
MGKWLLIGNQKIVEKSINQLLFRNEMGLQGPEQRLPGLYSLRVILRVKPDHLIQSMEVGEDSLEFGPGLIAQ